MPELTDSTLQTVMEVVKRVGEIAELAPDQDFYDAGLTSLASLTLLLELEPFACAMTMIFPARLSPHCG